MTCALGMDCALLRPPFRCSVTVRGVSCCCWTADSMVSRVCFTFDMVEVLLVLLLLCLGCCYSSRKVSLKTEIYREIGKIS